MYEIQNIYLEHFTINELENILQCEYIERYFFILHDNDLKPNGELKKAHYHILIQWGFVSNHPKHDLDNWCNNFLSRNGTKVRVENVRNVKKFMRYLTHKDNLEKFQYNDNMVYTNDIEYYQECITLESKLSKNDLLLQDYYNYLVDYVNSNGRYVGKPCQDFIFKFFSSKGAFDYYLKHITQLDSFTDLCIRDILEKDCKKKVGV